MSVSNLRWNLIKTLLSLQSKLSLHITIAILQRLLNLVPLPVLDFPNRLLLQLYLFQLPPPLHVKDRFEFEYLVKLLIFLVLVYHIHGCCQPYINPLISIVPEVPHLVWVIIIVIIVYMAVV